MCGANTVIEQKCVDFWRSPTQVPFLLWPNAVSTVTTISLFCEICDHVFSPHSRFASTHMIPRLKISTLMLKDGEVSGCDHKIY